MLRATLAAGVLAILLGCGVAAADAAPADAELKAEIEAFFHRTETQFDGRLHWDGAETFEVTASGDGATATLTNMRFSFRKEPDDPKPVVTLTLDRVEIRRKPAAGDPKSIELTIDLPALSTLVTAEGMEITLSLKDVHATALLENPGERQRAATLSLAGGRIEDKAGKGHTSFGPLRGNWKIVRTDTGSWTAPVDIELKQVEFLIAAAPLAGTIDRIVYAATAAGPDLAKFDAWRDRANELREAAHGNPDKKIEAWAGLLPELLTIFSSSRGELVVEKVTAKKPDGETLVTLAKAKIGGGFTGLDGEKAGFRAVIGHDGLTIAPSLIPETQVPRRALLDFGLDDIATNSLRALAKAASLAGPGASDADKQKAVQQLITGAMSLSPVFRVYDAAADFKNVGLDATAEVKRAPPVPIGYAGAGNITVRGFDSLPDIILSRLYRAQLPLLKFIGTGEAGPNAAPVKFHLASATGRWLTVNGNDLSAWFDAHVSRSPGPNPPRNLRLADPPMIGDDVRAVQQKLTASGEKFTDGSYDTATALAVARFQKQAGLNVDGVVDPTTRDKLGIKPPPPPPPPPAPHPANPTSPKN